MIPQPWGRIISHKSKLLSIWFLAAYENVSRPSQERGPSGAAPVWDMGPAVPEMKNSQCLLNLFFSCRQSTGWPNTIEPGISDQLLDFGLNTVVGLTLNRAGIGM